MTEFTKEEILEMCGNNSDTDSDMDYDDEIYPQKDELIEDERSNNLEELLFNLSDLIDISSIKSLDKNSIKAVESYDYKALEYILNNLKYFKSIIEEDLAINGRNINKSVWDILCKRYLGASKKTKKTGIINVKYNKINGKGRLFAEGSLALQSMFGVIRGTIARKYYRDIDIKNAHVVIALYLCKKLGLNHKSIEDYVNNRDDTLKLFGKDKDASKMLILKTMYGSKTFSKLDQKNNKMSGWLNDFAHETKQLSKALQKNYPKYFEDIIYADKLNGCKIYSLDGSFLSKIICSIENAILMRTLKFFKDKKIITNNFSLCFDGIMVPKKTFKKKSVKDTLKELSECILKDMNINISFVEKKMKFVALQVPYDYEEDESDEEEEEEISNELDIIFLRSQFSDGDIADYFCKRFNNCFTMFDNKLYKFNEVYWRECMAGEIYKHLNIIYFELLDILNKIYSGSQHTDFYTSSIKKILKLRTTKTMNNAWGSIKFRIEIQEDIFDLNRNLLGFQNGTYDLRKGEFRKGRIEDYITLTIPYDYEKVDTSECMEFLGSILPVPEEREFFLKMLSSSLKGETLNNFMVLTGSGRNGKNTICSDLLKKTMGKDFYYYGSSNIITDKPKSGANPEVASMHKKRVIIYNEPSPTDYLRGSTIKELTGGGEINARLCHSNNTETILHGTHIMMCNKKPLLDAVDDAISNRLYIIPFRALFLKPEKFKEYPEDTKYISEVNTYYQSDEFKEKHKLAFMNILMDYYKLLNADNYVLKNAPQSISDCAKEYLSDSDEFYGWFLNQYEQSDSDKDFIQIKDMFKVFKRSDYYQDLSKSRRRKANKKWMVSEIKTNTNLKSYYRARVQYLNEEKKQKNCRNVVLKFKKIQLEDDYDDE